MISSCSGERRCYRPALPGKLASAAGVTGGDRGVVARAGAAKPPRVVAAEVLADAPAIP